MAGDVAIGLGYVDLVVKDKGAADAIRKAERALRDLHREADRAAARVRQATFGMNEAMSRLGPSSEQMRRGLMASTAAIHTLNQAAATGNISMRSMVTSASTMAASFAALTGPLGAVVALFGALVGAGISARMRQLATDAAALSAATGMSAQGLAVDRGMAVDDAMGVGGRVGTATRLLRAIDPSSDLADQARLAAADTSFGSEARQIAAGLMERSAGIGAKAGSAYHAFRRDMQGQIAGAESELASASTLEAQVSARRRLLDLTQQFRDVMAEVAAINTEFWREQFGGDERLGDIERMTESIRAQTQALEEIQSTQAEVARTATEMADAFEAAAQAAGRSRDEIGASGTAGDRIRDEQTRRRADDGRRLAAGSQRLDVLRLRSMGYDAEADALERSHRFDELRRTASPEQRVQLDEEERLQAIISGRRGNVVRVGGTTDLLGGLRSIQQSVFGGGSGSSPEERTAKATREAADAARKAGELQQRAVELLKTIANQTRGGNPAVLG